MGEKQIIPEPPVRRRAESGMLADAPPPLAVVLWQYIRYLRDWIDVHPVERRTLFHEPPEPWVMEKREAARAVFPEIAAELRIIENLLSAPLAVDAEKLAGACDRLARWAEAQGYSETGMQFAEVAGLVDSENPGRANLAGRLARNLGDYVRAEVWLERGIGLARRGRNWVEYTRGHLGAGIMCMSTGRDARARRHLNTASTIAMREGHEWLAAEAQHDLFHFMTVRGNYVDAELHARRALAWYPKHHRRFPFFVADVAFLFVCERHYSAAAALLRRFVRVVKPPHNVLGFSVFVRALASSGKQKEFERARSRLNDLLRTHHEYEAAARWNLAHGERATGLWDAAKASARDAADLATREGDTETAQLARGLLVELDAGEPAPAEIQRKDNTFTGLVDELISRLLEWSPTRRGRSPSLSRSDWAA